MRLYVSGPMSAFANTDYNFPAFNDATRKLKAAGYEVENPADKGVIEGWTWEMYLRFDLKMLLECDGVALLPNWGLSQGAMLEKHVAEKLKMRVQSVEEWVALEALRWAVP